MAEPFKLTQEEVRALRDLTPSLNAAQQTIDGLKKIGLDVTEHEERLAQARRIRDGFLQQFAPTGVPR